MTGEERGAGGSSNFLLLTQTLDSGSDGAAVEAECHDNIGRTGTRGDGGEAQEGPRPKRAEPPQGGGEF